MIVPLVGGVVEEILNAPVVGVLSLLITSMLINVSSGVVSKSSTASSGPVTGSLTSINAVAVVKPPFPSET